MLYNNTEIISLSEIVIENGVSLYEPWSATTLSQTGDKLVNPMPHNPEF